MSHRIVDSLFELSSDRRTAIACGETVPVSFRIANLGNATAKSATATFDLPAELSLVEGSGLLDDVAVALAGGVVRLPPLEPLDERVVRVQVRAAAAIDDGTELVMRASYADEHGTDGISPALAFVACGSDQLNTRATRLKLQNAPNDRNALEFTVFIKNAGTSRADDVEIEFPLPSGLRFVEESLSAQGGDLAPFDPNRLHARFETIAAQTTATVKGRIAIVAPFASEAIAIDDVKVRGKTSAPFVLKRIAINALPAVDFSGSELAALDRPVAPGERIRFAFVAYNAGRSPARNVRVTASLPEGLAYSAATRTSDGSPLADRPDDGVTFALDAIAAGERVEFAFDATVLAPGDDGADLTTTVTLDWDGGEARTYEHALTIEAKPRISRSRSRFVALDAPIAEADSIVRFAATLANDGSTLMPSTQLRFALDAFDDLRLASGTPGTLRPVYDPAQKTVHFWYDAGTLDPHAPLDIVVEAHVPATIADRSEARVTAFARAASVAEIEIGSAATIVRSLAVLLPATTTMRAASDAPVRLHQTFEVRVHITNEGTDVLRDVVASLAPLASIVLERVTGAVRNGTTLSFADVPPGASTEAAIVARLIEPQRSGTALELTGFVTARGCDAVPIATAIPVFAQPALAEPTLALRALPGNVVEAEIVVENIGDGIADAVTLMAHAGAGFEPIPGSTRADGALVSDTADRSRLYGPYGLTIADVTPGIPVRIRWNVELDAARDPDVPLALSVDIRAGEAGSMSVVSRPFVRALAVPAETPLILEEPLAVPTAEAYAATPSTALSNGASYATPEEPPHEPSRPAYLSVRFTLNAERRGRVARTLDVLDTHVQGALIKHALVPRLLWPDGIDAGASGEERDQVDALLSAARESVRASTTTTLLKLEVPGAVANVALAESLDEPHMRSALAELIDLLAGLSGSIDEPEWGPNDLHATIALDTVDGLARRLDAASPGSPISSAVIAYFMSTQCEAMSGLAAALDAYWELLAPALDACRDAGDLLEPAGEELDARLDAVRAALAEAPSEVGIA